MAPNQYSLPENWRIITNGLNSKLVVKYLMYGTTHDLLPDVDDSVVEGQLGGSRDRFSGVVAKTKLVFFVAA